MKKLLQFSSLMLLAFMVSSCMKETAPQVEEETINQGNFLIKGSDESTVTKTTLDGLSTTWNGLDNYDGTPQLDSVGVFSPEARTTSTGTTPIRNRIFNPDESLRSTTFSGISMYASAAGVVHNFYSYYPRNNAYGTGTGAIANNVPISLPESQTQTDVTVSHIADLDFMVANPIAITPPSKTQITKEQVNFVYNHVFSLMEFTIVMPSGESANLKRVDVTTSGSNNLSLTSGTIDIRQATPSGNNRYTINNPTGTKSVRLTINGTCALTDNASTTGKALMMILPSDQTGTNNLTIDVYIEQNGTTKKATILKSGKDFGRNKKYTVSITNPTFQELAIDVPSIDWTQSYVYKVMNNGVQVGMVTKEYLRATSGNTVDAQAITYYTDMYTTVGWTDYADLTKGKVAQVLKTGSGETYNDVVGSSTINRSSLSFSTTTHTLTYTPSGSAQAAMTKIPFSVFGTGNYLDITISPMTMSDSRNYFANGAVQSGTYNYKVVKLATSYLTAENLRTTQYNDNSDISEITDNTAWTTTLNGAYCKYDNSNSNGNDFGLLYNGSAVGFNVLTSLWSGDRLAPNGWRATLGTTSSYDWKRIFEYLGTEASDAAGGKLKADGTTLWNSPNSGGTNIALFHAVANGNRLGDTGIFGDLGTFGYLWGAGANSFNYLQHNTSELKSTSGVLFIRTGRAVRCVKVTPWSPVL